MDLGAQGMLLLKKVDEYVDDETYGRISADLNDLADCSRWLINLVDRAREEPISEEEMETMLIDIDIAFVQHVSFHLKIFRKDINRLLASMPPSD